MKLVIKTGSFEFRKNNTKVFVILKSMRTFVMLTDGNCIYLAGQAVNLLNDILGFFSVPIKNIGGCLLRRYFALRGKPSVSSAMWQPLFPMPKTIIK